MGEFMLHSVDLGDFMLHDPITILPEDVLSTAVDLIIDRKVSGLCVTDKNDALLGILSEMDCLSAGLNQTRSDDFLSDAMVSEHMFSKPITIHKDEELYTAIKKIIEHRISGVCVVDKYGALVGILSEMDCLKAVLSAIYNDQRETDKVSAHMTKKVESCEPHSNLETVAADMLEKGRRRRPVVSNGRLVGQVTCRQILSAISQRGWDEDDFTPYMTDSIEYCTIGEDVVTVAKDMLTKGRRRRPVLSEEKLVGQITCRQLLRVVSEFNRNQVAGNFDPLYRDLL